mgnify:CR=1 FL=1
MSKRHTGGKKGRREQRVVEEMIALYCHAHHQKNDLCSQCQELAEYARMRTAKCPFMETKTFCSNCRVHCYDAAHRNGSRRSCASAARGMLLHHPWLAISHLIESKKEQRRLKEEDQ